MNKKTKFLLTTLLPTKPTARRTITFIGQPVLAVVEAVLWAGWKSQLCHPKRKRRWSKAAIVTATTIDRLKDPWIASLDVSKRLPLHVPLLILCRTAIWRTYYLLQMITNNTAATFITSIKPNLIKAINPITTTITTAFLGQPKSKSYCKIRFESSTFGNTKEKSSIVHFRDKTSMF